MPSAESATECLDELDSTQFALHSKSALLLFMMTAGTGMQWRENSNVDSGHRIDHGLGKNFLQDLTGNSELCIYRLTRETKVFFNNCQTENLSLASSQPISFHFKNNLKGCVKVDWMLWSNAS